MKLMKICYLRRANVIPRAARPILEALQSWAPNYVKYDFWNDNVQFVWKGHVWDYRINKKVRAAPDTLFEDVLTSKWRTLDVRDVKSILISVGEFDRIKELGLDCKSTIMIRNLFICSKESVANYEKYRLDMPWPRPSFVNRSDIVWLYNGEIPIYDMGQTLSFALAQNVEMIRAQINDWSV